MAECGLLAVGDRVLDGEYSGVSLRVSDGAGVAVASSENERDRAGGVDEDVRDLDGDRVRDSEGTTDGLRDRVGDR